MITADICAAAIIAAAKAFGDDPVVAASTKARNRRRAITAAASGVADGGGLAVQSAARIFGLAPTSISTARSNPDSHVFWKAHRAASRVAKALTPPPPPLTPAPLKVTTSRVGGGSIKVSVVGVVEGRTAIKPALPTGPVELAPHRKIPERAPKAVRAQTDGRPASTYLAPPPSNARVVLPSAQRGSRVAGVAKPISEAAVHARELDRKVLEGDFVRRKRAAGVPWTHIAQQLVVPVIDLRRRHDPEFVEP